MNHPFTGSNLDDMFASGALLRRALSVQFPPGEREPREIYHLIHDELLLDGVVRMNLAMFCTTWNGPELQQLAGV